jgi:hypothetical protein
MPAFSESDRRGAEGLSAAVRWQLQWTKVRTDSVSLMRAELSVTACCSLDSCTERWLDTGLPRGAG